MVTTKPLMKCGCVAQGVRASDGAPVCVTHHGIKPGWDEVAEVQPDLTGRMARCSYAMPGTETHSPSGGQYRGREFNSTQPSSFGLAFFAHAPDAAEDSFYCGCWGWD